MALVTAAQANPRPHGAGALEHRAMRPKGRLPTLTQRPQDLHPRAYSKEQDRTLPGTWCAPESGGAQKTNLHTRAQ